LGRFSAGWFSSPPTRLASWPLSLSEPDLSARTHYKHTNTLGFNDDRTDIANWRGARAWASLSIGRTRREPGQVSPLACPPDTLAKSGASQPCQHLRTLVTCQLVRFGSVRCDSLGSFLRLAAAKGCQLNFGFLFQPQFSSHMRTPTRPLWLFSAHVGPLLDTNTHKAHEALHSQLANKPQAPMCGRQ
jgi:hypothetical protein